MTHETKTKDIIYKYGSAANTTQHPTQDVGSRQKIKDISDKKWVTTHPTQDTGSVQDTILRAF